MGFRLLSWLIHAKETARQRQLLYAEVIPYRQDVVEMSHDSSIIILLFFHGN